MFFCKVHRPVVAREGYSGRLKDVPPTGGALTRQVALCFLQVNRPELAIEWLMKQLKDETTVLPSAKLTFYCIFYDLWLAINHFKILL